MILEFLAQGRLGPMQVLQIHRLVFGLCHVFVEHREKWKIKKSEI